MRLDATTPRKRVPVAGAIRKPGLPRARSRGLLGRAAAWLTSLSLLACLLPVRLAAADAPAAGPVPLGTLFTNGLLRFQVQAYSVRGDPLLTGPLLTSVLERHTGADLTVQALVDAAAELQRQYADRGHTNVTIAIARDRITNGVVTMNVFRGAVPQVVVDGRRCALPAPPAGAATEAAAASPTSAPAPSRTTAASAPIGFLVRTYDIKGNTLLASNLVADIVSKHTGTNITVADIIKAGSDLQMEYRNRGYVTARVTIPPQKIDTNAVVMINVTEGRLVEINVVGNRFFSSNNVMRALPSLHTNTMLIGDIFEAELGRANANQDRAIRGELKPGPEEGTSALDLKVKDRLPLHAKVDFNNQNSPGTPELRVNSSLLYNNLWQYEHSLGFQYGFSPTQYKAGNQWNFYDLPLVANYGGFYRLPLGNPADVSSAIAGKPGSFGYDEATRRFRLPASTGRPELNLFASRSTVDTGLMTLYNAVIFSTNNSTLERRDVQRDLTVNGALGARIAVPFHSTATFQSGFSGGLDYKSYEIVSVKTNVFTLTSTILDTISSPGQTITNINVSTVNSPVPTTTRALDYLPLALRYSASLRDPRGATSFGLGLGVNAWYSGSIERLRTITLSDDSSGHWVTLTPSFSREFHFRTNWVLAINASGQWATEPLISNEQFGIGGVGSVRGYHEGEVFGNSGWYVTAEQKTPPFVVGRIYGNSALSVRGSVFMGYGQAFSLSPRNPQELWGAGLGGAASIGPNWETRFLFSWPLISTRATEAGQPRFDFGLSAQF
jgi:hemolysin activation/secretion protein